MKVHLPLVFGLILGLCATFATPLACKRSETKPPETPTIPTLRVYVASTVAGAMEPCGCQKDMLGGVDHAAQLVQLGRTEAPHSIVVGAGPMLFLNPEIAEDRKAQDLWKAEGIADAFAKLGFLAWAPGTNDFAAGAATLSELAQRSRAQLLAGNLAVPGLTLGSTHVFEVAGHRIGLAGVSQIKEPTVSELKAQVSELEPALKKALVELQAQRTQINIALVAVDRGEALRLAERVEGFQLMVVGKPLDRGETNDAPTTPRLIGSTLVVHPPNHLQALSVVDLFVRDGELAFADASGLTQLEERQSLERRARELAERIAGWEKNGANADDVAARKADLAEVRQRIEQLVTPKAPERGSFFRYTLSEVRENLGSDKTVLAGMTEYYRRVNEHNRELFKDRRPQPAEAGAASYVGIQRCAECHEEAYVFWQKTGHAKAYKTLTDDFKEFNLDCVSCHVTGYERPGGSTVTFVEGLKDVQCEECHGAGSIHAKTESIDSITLRPEKSVCVKCHHPPHVHDTWSADEAWTHIVGKGHGEGSKP